MEMEFVLIFRPAVAIVVYVILVGQGVIVAMVK